LHRCTHKSTGTWFDALVSVFGEGFNRDLAQRFCQEQGAEWSESEYTRAVNAGQEVESPAETGPLLNDLKASDYPNLAQWVAAVVSADPLVTVEHVRQLAAEQGRKGAIGGAYSKAVRTWREARGLAHFPREGRLVPRPACWTAAMGNDPAAWPTPQMRSSPSIKDLLTEQTRLMNLNAAFADDIPKRAVAHAEEVKRLQRDLAEAEALLKDAAAVNFPGLDKISQAIHRAEQLQAEVAEVTESLRAEQQARRAAEQVAGQARREAEQARQTVEQAWQTAEQARKVAEQQINTAQEDLAVAKARAAQLQAELLEAVARRSEPAPPGPAPASLGLEALLAHGQKVHALTIALGPETPWARVAEVLQIFLES